MYYGQANYIQKSRIMGYSRGGGPEDQGSRLAQEKNETLSEK
jgi:hypothetical protein